MMTKTIRIYGPQCGTNWRALNGSFSNFVEVNGEHVGFTVLCEDETGHTEYVDVEVVYRTEELFNIAYSFIKFSLTYLAPKPAGKIEILE